MIPALVLKNSSVMGVNFSIPSSWVRRVKPRQSAKSTVTSERRPVSQCDSHRLRRFGFDTLRRTPRNHQYQPAGPVNGIPSARHRGESIDTTIPLEEFIAFNTPQKLRQDSSTTSARPAPPMRSQDACSRARASLHGGRVNHRNSVSRRTVGMSANEPTMSRFSRSLRTPGVSGA